MKLFPVKNHIPSTKQIIKVIVSVYLFSVFFSCSSTKFIPDGEYLLDKIKIESDIPDYKSMDIKPYVRQQPNYKMFGLNKTMFQIYNLSGKDTSKWHNRFIRKIGEAPVIYDSALVEKTNSEISKLFINKGYVNVEVQSEIIKRKKKAKVIYKITGKEPYRIRHYATAIEDTTINRELFGGANNTPFQHLQGEGSIVRTTKVKENDLFDRNILNEERERLTTLLRNRGYFSFSKDYFLYDADSTLNANAVDLTLKLRSLSNTSKTNQDSALYRKYYIDKVAVYLDYEPLRIFDLKDYQYGDSISIGKYTFHYFGKKPSIRPRTLLENNFISPDRLYAQLREDLTYSSYSRLQALNNTQIQFHEKLRNDSAFLDCQILTIPAKKQAIEFSLEGTNTSGDLGVASTVSYTHRNLFKGSEVLNLRLRGAYEALSKSNLSSYFEFGGEASVDIPKFLFPFLSPDFSRRQLTSTEFSLSYNYQTRPEYDRILLSGGIRYQWKSRGKTSSRRQLNLIDVDYVYLPYKNEKFMESLPENAKYFGYTNQFIVGSSYTYHKSTFDPFRKDKSAFSFRYSIESAGNFLYAISSLFDRKKDKMGSYQLFDTYFAQFVKGDFDYARTILLDKQNTIAWRIGLGIGVPYGNTEMLPFEKRYYSGGANSVRGWSVRELGPGSYVPTKNSNFFHQSGDIKFDFNIEYRTRFFWKFEAAAFIDAGNIWTIKDYEEQEGGKFKFNSFYKEIALGYGTGLRMDFDYFLIRFDFGWKAYDPSKRGKDRWAIMHPNFKNNFAWHIAVGYPF